MRAIADRFREHYRLIDHDRAHKESEGTSNMLNATIALKSLMHPQNHLSSCLEPRSRTTSEPKG